MKVNTTDYFSNPVRAICTESEYQAYLDKIKLKKEKQEALKRECDEAYLLKLISKSF